MTTAEQRFEADKKIAYRALQDARQYVTDFDRAGNKAEVLYARLDRARSMMQPWSTDGSPAQARKAIEYLREIRSILSEKIGPASRREFSEQGGTRHHASKKSASTLQREIDDVLFEEAKAKRNLLEAEVASADRILKAFPHGPMGLTPDNVKRSLQWRAANDHFQTAFTALRKFNETFTKTFARELRAERDKRYRR